MRTESGLLTALAFALAFAPGMASADELDVGPRLGGFQVQGDQRVDQSRSGDASTPGQGAGNDPAPVETREAGRFRCDEETGFCWGLLPVPSDSVPQAPVQVTQAMVLRALRRVEVPAVRVRVQPPGGKTLVNLETIFSAEAAAFERTVRLLGRRVDLVVRPVSFRWSHGDGTSQQSTTAGVAYRRDRDPDGYITHRYLRVAKVQVGVEVDFAARFRVDGGRWQDVDGVVTVASAPQALQVVEARPTLVTP